MAYRGQRGVRGKIGHTGDQQGRGRWPTSYHLTLEAPFTPPSRTRTLTWWLMAVAASDAASLAMAAS